MMLEKLPENLDETLRLTANEEQIARPLDDK
jgi:hypothetical protein